MQTWLVVMLVLTSGCGKKSDDWPARAGQWLASIKESVAEKHGSSAAFRCRDVEISEDNEVKHEALVTELRALCHVEVPRLVLIEIVEHAEKEQTPLTCPTAALDGAIADLRTANKLAELKPVFTRLSVACKDYKLPPELVPTAAEVAAIPQTPEQIAATAKEIESELGRIKRGIPENMAFLVMTVCDEVKPKVDRLRTSVDHKDVVAEIERLCSTEVPIASMKWLVPDMEKRRKERANGGQSSWCYLSGKMQRSAAALQPTAVDDAVRAHVRRWNAACSDEAYRVVLP